jgi:L-arabinose isomerase
VRPVFTAGPRPGIVVSLADMRDRFRLTANAVQSVEPPEALPRLPAGPAHHTVMSTAVGADAFAGYARIAGYYRLAAGI